MGGGAMRTAAKATGFAAGSRGYRPPATFGAGRRGPAATLPSAAGSVGEAAPPISVLAGDKAAAEPPVAAAGAQWPSWEVDDWEFTDWKAEQEETTTRLVFGPAPTLEEAKEATSDLKDALDRVYFSEASCEVPKEQDLVHKKLRTDAIVPSMPGHVVQAFSLLKASPEAQSVVASLAADKNVWDAVMKNEKVMEFYRNHQSSPIQAVTEESITVDSPENLDDSTTEKPLGAAFTDFVDNAKKTVMELVSNISNFFQDVFRNPSETQNATSPTAEKSTSNPFFDAAVGGTFIALAIAVILVVLVKRG